MSYHRVKVIKVGSTFFRFNTDQFMLFLYCITNIHIFYLLPSNSITRSMTFFISVIWSAMAALRKTNHKKVINRLKFPLLYLLLIIIAAIQSKNLYGQPILLGLFPQRISIAAIVVLFPILIAIHNNTLNYNSIMAVLKVTVVVEVFFCLIQFILGERFSFLKVLMYEHNNRLRIYADVVMMQFVYFDCLSKLTTDRSKNRIKDLLIIVLTLIYIIVVIQHRSTVLCLFALTVVAALLWRKITGAKLFAILIILICGFVLLNSSYFINILENITHNTGTFMVRANSRMYYIEKIKEHYWLGCGYANSDYSFSSIYSGMAKGYLLADNGVYGYIFSYGLLGLFWYVILLGKMLIGGIKSYRATGNQFILLCVMFLLLGSYTFSWFFEMNMIFITLMIAFFNSIQDIERNNQ